jgi:hypothetical protein
MNSEDRQASRDLRNKGIRAKFRVPVCMGCLRQAGVLRVVFAAVTCALIGVVPATAQPEVIRCLPPEAPITELPAEVLAEYRIEIAAEFEAYFAKLSEYIACLDAERSRAMGEAQAATEAYTRLINTISAAKDHP